MDAVHSRIETFQKLTAILLLTTRTDCHSKNLGIAINVPDP